MTAKYTLEGDGLAGEGWNIKPEVVATIWTELCEALFEAVVNSSWHKNRFFRLIFDRQVWLQLTSITNSPWHFHYKGNTPGICSCVCALSCPVFAVFQVHSCVSRSSCFAVHHGKTLVGLLTDSASSHLIHRKGKIVEACSRAHAFTCHSLHLRDQVLGCAKPGTAWKCVSW